MPRLAAFATCDSVLHDQEQHPSLIHVFTSVLVRPKPADKLERNTATARQWQIFTMWQADDDDIGQDFAQICHIAAPEGQEVGTATLSFKMNAPSHNLFVTVPFLPVGIQGRISVRVWLEKDGEKITDETELSVRIIHALPQQAIEEPTASEGGEGV